MPSYWERRAQEARQRSLAAQAARYSRQAPQFPTVSSPATSVVQEPARQLAERRAQAEARVAQAQRERERRELEAAQRAQAEARANFAQSQREFEALSAAEAAFPTQNLFGQPSGLPENSLDFYSRRTERQQNQDAMRDFWEYVAYGPERRSVFGDGDAGKGERFARDWGASEQEFREGAGRLGEGRVVSGAGFLGLGALGVGLNVGDVRRLGFRLSRASRFLPGVADSGRVAEAAEGVAGGFTPRRRPTDDNYFEELAASRREMRVRQEAREAEQRVAEQIKESNEFRRREAISRRQQEIDFDAQQRLARTPAGPQRVSPEGVMALEPITPSPRITSDPIKAGLDDLLSRGIIRPRLAGTEEIVGRIVRQGSDAFPGVSSERISEAAAEAIGRTPQIRYQNATPYARGQSDAYRAGGAADQIQDLRLLERVGDILGMKPQRGYALPENMPAVVQRFNELEPAIAVPLNAFQGILSRGRFLAPQEIGKSSSLGFMSPRDRLELGERGRFGVREGYLTQPVYGYLVGRRGTAAQPWEAREFVGQRGTNITSETAATAYGPISIRFNNNLRPNTSFIFGDSIIQPGGVGRPLNNVTEADVALAGVHTSPRSSYIEAQIWDAPRVEDIASITAPKGLHDDIRRMLDEAGLNVDIYDYGSNVPSIPARSGGQAADSARAAENLRAATIARATPEQISSVSSVGPLPNRAKEAVTQQSKTLDSLRETQLSTMHRLTPDNLEELRRASPAVRQMSPDNIWVIHETSFPPSRSGNDTVLRPTADYVSETGRHSVHFSLNHSAAGHELRQGAGSRYVVAARLSDVLEANPGSLDNLYSVDTFFTPRPGEGLRIPNATVLEDAQSVTTQQAIRNLIEESGGVAIAGGPRYSPITGVDVRIRQLAEELKVPSMTHDGHPLFSFESNFLNGFGNADPNFYLPLMSDNARLRVSSENVWTHPRMDSQRRFRVPGDENV